MRLQFTEKQSRSILLTNQTSAKQTIDLNVKQEVIKVLVKKKGKVFLKIMTQIQML